MFNPSATAEYIPTWMKNAARKPAPSSISVTRTSNNVTSAMVRPTATPPLYSSHTQVARQSAAPPHVGENRPSPQSMPSPGLVGRSPTILKRLPVRMSPMIFPTKNHMNPDAAEFVPGKTFAGVGAGAGGVAHHGLEALPSSTADMEAVQRQPTTTPNAVTAPHPRHPSQQRRRSVPTSPIMGPVVLDHKTESEILEISRRSALSVAAAAYIPKRTMTRVVLAKPSPLTLVPSADPATDQIEMMLDDLWCLFYMPVNWTSGGGKGGGGGNSNTSNNAAATNGASKEEEFNPMLVFRIDSIPTFWKVFNNIPTPTEMQPSTLYLFRDGIDPKWEDAANRDGGIVKIKVGANDIDEAWELLLCRTMGDSWSPTVRNTVNGVALKVRERAFLLEVWVTKQTPELMKDLADLWQPVLGATFVTVYYTHNMLQERAHAAADKQKKQQQQQQRRRY